MTARVQEAHGFLLHALCEAIEPDLQGGAPAGVTGRGPRVGTAAPGGGSAGSLR